MQKSIVGAAVICIATLASAARTNPFIIDADISWLPARENAGHTSD
jgi:hypothetical protein